MVAVEKNRSLLPFNTFGIDVKAQYFCSVNTVDELQTLILSPLYRDSTRLMLGGGSNILFTRDFSGLVIKMAITGIEIVKESDDLVIIKAFAGTTWHNLVMHCVNQNWGGLENLSLIPGTVGAAPIQNIGAYGVEIAERVEKVEGIDTTSAVLRTFDKDECRFGYRESAFKVDLKEKYFVSSVTLSLTKKNHHFNIQYGAIQETLKRHHVDALSVKAVSDAVIDIRQQKLPDPHHTGNAGSFFKNPTIAINQFMLLQKNYPSIPSYPVDNQYIKVPAAWLIEQCGWKGKRFDNIGVHPLQALVLVHYGGESGDKILQLARQIQSSVKEKFGVELTPEVNIF